MKKWIPEDPSIILWPSNPFTGPESKMPRGPHGRKLCRCGCGREVHPPRRCFYNDECQEAYTNFRHWGILRSRVILRDKGICQICGIAVKEFVREVWELRKEFKNTQPSLWEDLKKCLRHEGWKLRNHEGIECDHIIPRCKQGTDHPDNLRTLCEPCHKGETNKLLKELKLAGWKGNGLHKSSRKKKTEEQFEKWREWVKDYRVGEEKEVDPYLEHSDIERKLTKALRILKKERKYG